MSAEEQAQIAVRARKLQVQIDQESIALQQRGVVQPTPEEAIGQLRAVAPLLQALVRYQLRMLSALAGDTS